MRRFRAALVGVGLSLVLSACAGGQHAIRQSAGVAVIKQRAALILSYPHDHHVFGELPSGLAPVSAATAELERHAGHVDGTIETRIRPGHVGKLVAVVINHPAACTVPTPGGACGPHEEEFNPEADGGFYLGSGDVAGPDGRIRLTVRARAGDTSNVLCRGAANPLFDACARGFSLRDPRGAEVALVVLDNGPAADDVATLARQLAAITPCPTCPSFTVQVAIGFGREPQASSRLPQQGLDHRVG